MIPEIQQHRAEIEALCRRYGVLRLKLFGSAVAGEYRSNMRLEARKYLFDIKQAADLLAEFIAVAA
ncbi:MAG: hypothetical protein ACREQ8_03745 [Woeseiaceae bacterium]